MSTTSHDQMLSKLFEQFGMRWFTEAFASEPTALMDRFNDFVREYQRTVADCDELPSRVSVDSLQKMAEENPDRANAFLQVFASSCSPQMLAMAWALQHDTHVASIDLHFEESDKFELRIELRVGRNGATLHFKSESIFDMAVIRHFGVLQSGGSPVVSGLYPLNLDWA